MKQQSVWAEPLKKGSAYACMHRRNDMKVWKRCLAALLAFIIFGTSANISEAAGVVDAEDGIWKATAAEIVAESYGLTEKEAELINAEIIRKGTEFEVTAPHENGTADKEDLVAVDYRERIVYAKELEADGYTWLPTEAVLVAEGEEKEQIPLTEGAYTYHEEDYDAASATFTYTGKNYTVIVSYELSVGIAAEEQTRLLAIPGLVVQPVKNLEKSLKANRISLGNLGTMIPHIKTMSEMSVPKTQVIEAGKSVGEEPAFNTINDREVLDAIDSLYKEYMADPENPALNVFALCEEYRGVGSARLNFAFQKGAEVQTESESLYQRLSAIDKSARFSTVFKLTQTANPELYDKIKNFNTYLNRVLEALEVLRNPENWQILDENTKAAVLKEDYELTDFEALESMAYKLRSTTLTEAAPASETLVAAKVDVSCVINICEVTVTVSGSVAGRTEAEADLIALEPQQTTILLLSGMTEEEVRAEIEASGVEKQALELWNALEGDYRVNASNYVRKETSFGASLNQDIPDYQITYTPNYYDVKTDFMGDGKYPYGYRIIFPVNTDETGFFDYKVVYADGREESYDQGHEYRITADAEITRVSASVKYARRLLDFLAEDVRYDMTTEMQKILKSSALESPQLKIRMPGADCVSEIVYDEDGFYVTAKNASSGINGMEWKPANAVVMDGSTEVENIGFSGGKAFWTSAQFTHVNVNYELNITMVKGSLFNRPLEPEEIFEYANLPAALVKEVTKQNQVLCGEDGINAKKIYDEMQGYASYMGMLPVLSGFMETKEAQNALLRLQGSEDQIVKDADGKELGYGGWSFTSGDPRDGEAAIFKYLKLCEDSGWSLATYYKEGYYADLAIQARLLSECLDAVLKDPGLNKLPEQIQTMVTPVLGRLEKVVPDLKELADSIEGPHPSMKVNDSKFPVLISDILAAEGNVKSYSSAGTIFAYNTVRRNDVNTGTITIQVDVAGIEKSAILDYSLDTIEENEKYHVLTEDEEARLWSMLADLKDQCGWEEDKAAFFDQTSTAIPAAGAKVGKNEIVSFVYSPKTYTVTIDGVSTSEYLASFQYGSNYVIPLPAKSTKPSSKVYYVYTFRDAAGEVITERAVENGTTGSYAFTEEDLLTLFVSGGYTISRSEGTVKGKPHMELKINLSNDLVRGKDIDSKKSYLYLDVKPEGITRAELLNEKTLANGKVQKAPITVKLENSVLKKISFIAPGGYEYADEDIIVNGTELVISTEDIYGNLIEKTYMIIIMGDVNSDGKNTREDSQMVMQEYFVDKEAGDVPMLGKVALAANMNNNKKIDSNDAWLIRSKSLYWNADKKLNQIVYKSVLK